MLTEQEIREIGEKTALYGQKRGAVIEALKIVQKYRRWIDEQSINDIAALLDLTVDEVDGVATCYDRIYRRPVGRHVILVCDNVSCWLTGHPDILRKLELTLGIGLGETTGDGRFTLLPSPCLGACERSPAIMIDHDLHGNLTPEIVGELLNRYE